MDIKTYNSATELLKQIDFLKVLLERLCSPTNSITIGPVEFSNTQGGRIKSALNGQSFFFTGFGEFEQKVILDFKELVSSKIGELELQFKKL